MYCILYLNSFFLRNALNVISKMVRTTTSTEMPLYSSQIVVGKCLTKLHRKELINVFYVLLYF